MFVVSLYSWQDGGRTMEAYKGDSIAIFKDGEFIRLFTSILLHAHLKHLISNAIFFLFFSYLLYGYFGFWVYPVLAVLLGGLVNYLTLLTYPEGVSILGASGVVYLMAGFWFTSYVFIERSRSVNKRILHVMGVSLILLIPSAVSPEVSYSSHMIGFAAGVASGLVYYFRNRERLRAREVRVPEHDEDLPPDRFERNESITAEEDEKPWIM